MISFIIPTYNNLKHLKNVYASIQKHTSQVEVVLLDDGSTDGSWEWIQQQDVIKYRSNKRVGHTILYDKGIELATNDIVGILHADMILGPGYVDNMLKNLSRGKVVCATRIEPPLHPEGREKVIRDFGLDFDTLDIPSFESFCQAAQQEYKDQTTKGMFAPWILYKEDFLSIGGHDPIFAPFPYEDSDIFQRWILAGYELIQSRDAFVYHLTCRGHRWNDQIGKDDEYYKIASAKASKNYLRKWGSWIKNNEFQYPIIFPKYNIHAIIKNCNEHILAALEPWFYCVHVETDLPEMVTSYYTNEQRNTSFDLRKRIKLFDSKSFSMDNIDILVEIDALKFTNNSYNIVQQLSEIISQSGEIGDFELDSMKVTITNMTTYENKYITNSDPYYLSQLL